MDRQLSMEFARITEQAAVKSGRLMGKGDKEGADQLAVDGMHEQFAKTPVSGTVVIGEGEMDEAPMLYIGEHVGAGGEEIDIAVDPVEGTNLVAKGQDGASRCWLWRRRDAFSMHPICIWIRSVRGRAERAVLTSMLL